MNTEEAQCPIETTLRLINGKWKLRILKELLHSNIRFGQILKNKMCIRDRFIYRHTEGLSLNIP